MPGRAADADLTRTSDASLLQRSQLLCACCLVWVVGWPLAPIVLSAEMPAPPDGFSALFNGKDLSGWCGRSHTHPQKFRQLSEAERDKRQAAANEDLEQHWRVENGELVNDGKGVFCTTVDDYRDFELLLDWKMLEPHTDSGIYLRGCPQVQIWDPNNPKERKHGAHLGSGGLWNNNPGSPGKNPLVKADRPIGQWNTLRILLIGGHATVELNGQKVVDHAVMHNFWDRSVPLYEQGPIQLQTHGGEMRFRNLYLREILEKHPSNLGVDDAKAYSTTIPGTEVTFDMVPIPGGEFRMGSPATEPGHQDDEGPQVKVRIRPYWMGKHEVSWAEYQQFMELCNVFEKFNDKEIRQLTEENQIDAVTAPSKLYEPSFTYETGDDPRQPAISMSQYAAKQYTKWLSLLTGTFYRLPSEAEWEYACRAGTTTPFSFGDNPELLPEFAWYFKQAEEEYVTSEVGQRKPNAWGLYDMHGNVAEWVLDQYEADYYAKFAEKTVDAHELINWPTKLYPRVLRGGSWSTEEPSDLRSAARHQSNDDEWRSYDPNSPQSPWWFASDEGQTVGFRLVRPSVPPPRAEWNKYWDADLETIQRHVDRRIDEEGRGERGMVDPKLPEAIDQLEANK